LLDATDSGFGLADVGRIRIIEELTRRGISLDDLARVTSEGTLSFGWFGGVLPPPPHVRAETYEELFDRVGIPVDLATGLFEVWGVAMPAKEALVREDDARLFELLGGLAAFMGDSASVLLLEGTRYLGDSARRNSEAEIDFFRRRIVDPLLDSGLSLKEAIDVVNPLTAELVRPGVMELLLWLHRRHIDALNMQMLVQMVELALEDAGVDVPSQADPPAIVFVDISEYTRRTDESGDEDAAELAARFSEIVRREVTRSGGGVVKFLGDGVMLYFADPEAGVRCARRLLDLGGNTDLPPMHAGVDVGTVVFRDGDYFGRTVNRAARIAEAARPGELLISQEAADAVGETVSSALLAVGQFSLKGVAEPVSLLRFGELLKD
jgi:adenylate cyclase